VTNSVHGQTTRIPKVTTRLFSLTERVSMATEGANHGSFLPESQPLGITATGMISKDSRVRRDFRKKEREARGLSEWKGGTKRRQREMDPERVLEALENECGGDFEKVISFPWVGSQRDL
jgi:hypothetical protein